MKKVLILVNEFAEARALKTQLQQQAMAVMVLSGQQDDLTNTASYLKALEDANVLISLLGPLDVDLDFEALFDAINQVMPPLNLIIMLSTAGLDHEVVGHLDYPGVNDVHEYLNQQRYAVKLVDESEVPYTVLRPVKIVEHPAGKLRIIDEGQPIPSGVVSRGTVDQVILKVVTSGQYLNHSIGLIERKEE